MLLLTFDVTAAEAVTVWAAFIVITIGCITRSLPWSATRAASSGYASLKRVSGGPSWEAKNFIPGMISAKSSLGEVIEPVCETGGNDTCIQKKQPVVFDQGLAEFFQMATLVEAIMTDRLLPSYREMLDKDVPSSDRSY